MDVKDLYWGALRRFQERNEGVLPQLQLQYGANERWFAREFTLAMNCHLAGSWSPDRFQRYADCEYRYGDISVWEGPTALALYEVKALYSDMSEATIGAVVEKAAGQLSDQSGIPTERKVGLFFAVFYGKGSKATAIEKAQAFEGSVRSAVRTFFESDHNIRMTELSGLTEIDYGHDDIPESWHTQSWVTWGQPKRT